MDKMNSVAPETQPVPATLPVAPEIDEDSRSLGKKILDYFEPRSTTGADLQYSSPGRAAMGGGIQGFFVGGPTGAIGGAAGGYIGTRIGEEMHSMKSAIAASAVSGAGSILLATSLLPFVMGNPSSVGTYIATLGLVGGAAGAAGSLTGVLENERHREALKESVHRLFGKDDSLADESVSQEPSALGKAANITREAVHKIGQALKPLLDKIPAKVLAAAMGAGIGAATGVLGGPVGMAVRAATGAVTGFAGATLAEHMSSVKEQGTKKALVKGIGLGTALTASAGAIIGAGAVAAISGNPGLSFALLGCGLIGALSGTAGALSGSRLASVRDGSTGGFITGMISNSFLGNKGALMLTPLAASVGGAVGAKGKNVAWKVILGALSGGAIGAGTAIIGGPISALVGAAIGGTSGVIGALAGTKLQQGIRNLTEDIQKKVTGAADSVTGKLMDKLGEDRGVAAAGFLSGAVGSIPLAIMGGLVFGLPGALVPPLLLGAFGAYKLHDQIHDVGAMGMVQKQFKEHGPSIEDLTDRMVSLAAPNLMEQLKGLPEEEQKQHLVAFGQGTYRELKKIEPLIDNIEGALSAQLYRELKKELKHRKTDEEKEKFLEQKFTTEKAALAHIVITQVIAIMSAREQSQATPARG